METILAIFGLVLGVFFYRKWQNAEAVSTNQKLNEDLNVLDKDKSKNEGLLEAEDLKRKELQEKFKILHSTGDIKDEDLVTWLNNLFPPSK